MMVTTSYGVTRRAMVVVVMVVVPGMVVTVMKMVMPMVC